MAYWRGVDEAVSDLHRTKFISAKRKNICGNTSAYFGKNACVFAEIRLRFSANKFAGLRNAEGLVL